MNWPIGMGQQFKSIYELATDRLVCFQKSQGHHIYPYHVIQGLDSNEARELLGLDHAGFVDEIELVRGACHEYDQDDFERAPSVRCILAPRWATSGCSKCLMASGAGPQASASSHPRPHH